MRVAYVVGWPEGPSSGPFKKIRSQTAAWSAAGVEVGLFVLTIERYADDWRSIPAVRSILTRPSGPALALQKERLIAHARRWKPDVIYHRWALAYPGLVRAAARETVVVEVNTDDVIEYDLMAPLKGRINRLTRSLVLRRVAGLAFVTHELVTAPAFAPFRKPSVVVANGICLSDVPHVAAPDNNRPRLLFIGQPNCPWHGLDKLSVLARERPGWDFDVVGPASAEVDTPPSNMRFHGLLAAEEYARLLASADVGVGTLALHRKGLDEASPLKVREYLATGLPVIIGYRDTDFLNGADFLLALPNREDNVEEATARIDDFVRAWKGRRVPRGAITHVDDTAKESVRLDFFRSLVS